MIILYLILTVMMFYLLADHAWKDPNGRATSWGVFHRLGDQGSGSFIHFPIDLIPENDSFMYEICVPTIFDSCPKDACTSTFPFPCLGHLDATTVYDQSISIFV